jgi:peptidoglycan hydrolase-like protein with peptidoglycan-binding domain
LKQVVQTWPGSNQGLIAWAKAQPKLRRGDKGPKVVELQQLLTAAGFPVPSTGNFLDRTRAAVVGFQQTHEDWDGSRLDDDGVVGSRTWWSLAQRHG